MKRRRQLTVLIALVALAGCRTGRNYGSPEGPRYVGTAVTRVSERANPDTLKVVTFNIQYSLRLDSALVVLTTDSAVRDPDIVLLQEVDEPSTRRIAETLGLAYVYYPTTYHFKHKRDVGNAVLSRWPILADAKIPLPYLGLFTRAHRTATAATIQVGEDTVRVYSLHLGTVANIGPEERRDQLRGVLADAAEYPRVIIGGDMNYPTVGEVAQRYGYQWPTERGPRTAIVGRVDHIFLKGLHSTGAGTVVNQRHSSDHRPVWVIAALR